MKVLASFELADATTDTDAFINIWTVSLIWWLNKENNVEKPLSEDLQKLLSSSLDIVSSFLRKYRIPTTTFNRYFTSIEYNHAASPELIESRVAVIDALKPVKKYIFSDRDVSFDRVALLKSLFAWHSSGNPKQIDTIRKMLVRIKAPGILQRSLSKEVEEQTEHVDKLKEIVKKITGKPGVSIPIDKVPEYREKNPTLWKEYLQAAANVRNIYKQKLHNYVTETGNGEPVDIEKVRKHMESEKIVHQLPHIGFKGKIDGEGRLYTKEGSRLQNVAGDPTSEIRMNPDYDPEKDAESGKNNNWVMQRILPTVDAKGKNRVQYVYTEGKKAVNKTAKFGVVQEMLKVENKMVSAWRKDLFKKDAATVIPACQCEVTYLTACRIGGEGNENRHGKTFGLTTWTVGNIKRRGESIIIDYVGKDSVNQVHKISPATPSEERVIYIIKRLCEGKKRSDPLWEMKGIKYGDAKLRAYFAKVCPVPDATFHKIRHLKGTRLAISLLDPLQEKLLKQRKPPTQAEVDKDFKDAMTKVGQLLGHVRGVQSEAKATWSTAVQSYVDPQTMLDFYDAFGNAGMLIRPPKFLTVLK